VTGLALGRSLGCLVAARLAARHGISVQLRPGDVEGVDAYVVLPRHLLDDVYDVEARPTEASTTVADEAWFAGWDDPADQPEQQPASHASTSADPAGPPDQLVEAIPARADFDAGLQALLDREEDLDAIDPGPDAGEGADHPDVRPPSLVLQRRVPGATAEALVPVSDEPRVRRSPDEVRALLSRYRSGLLAGRDTDDHRDEERS
jgi:hypothetical protein